MMGIITAGTQALSLRKGVGCNLPPWASVGWLHLDNILKVNRFNTLFPSFRVTVSWYSKTVPTTKENSDQLAYSQERASLRSPVEIKSKGLLVVRGLKASRYQTLLCIWTYPIRCCQRIVLNLSELNLKLICFAFLCYWRILKYLLYKINELITNSLFKQLHWHWLLPRSLSRFSASTTPKIIIISM